LTAINIIGFPFQIMYSPKILKECLTNWNKVQLQREYFEFLLLRNRSECENWNITCINKHAMFFRTSFSLPLSLSQLLSMYTCRQISVTRCCHWSESISQQLHTHTHECKGVCVSQIVCVKRQQHVVHLKC